MASATTPDFIDCCKIPSWAIESFIVGIVLRRSMPNFGAYQMTPSQITHLRCCCPGNIETADILCVLLFKGINHFSHAGQFLVTWFGILPYLYQVGQLGLSVRQRDCQLLSGWLRIKEITPTRFSMDLVLSSINISAETIFRASTSSCLTTAAIPSSFCSTVFESK